MSENKLQISDTLSLPVNAVTQTFALLGIRGSGKTNTAVCMMEEMLKIGQQCVALDPTNGWYGIRSSRDGKSAGFKVYVFGGPNGDLPLEGTHGSIMADFVVETGASVIFSLRHLSMNDQRRFAMEFGERLHHLKGRPENKTPLCLFLDEADEFVPQRIPKGYERMFGAYDRLVRRDRNCGLGVVLISQRPQVINKDTLSQIETLICHRLLHKLDRKSVKEAWVEGHDVKGKADEFFDGLATLSKGDAWVWSPEWLDIFKRVHIRQRETFDSSATPKSGEKVKVAHRLAEVDLGKLQERLAATVEKARADDPRELRKVIEQLKREMGSGKLSKSPERVVEKSSSADRSVIRQLRAGLVQAMKIIVKVTTFGFDGTIVNPDDVKSALERAAVQIANIAEAAVSKRNREFTSLKSSAESLLKKLKGLIEGEDIELDVKAIRNEPVTVTPMIRKPRLAPSSGSNGSGDHLPPGERATLIAAAQFNGVERDQLSVLTGYKRSSRDAYVARLLAKGYVDVQGRTITPTQSGVDALGSDYQPLPTGSALYDYWEQRLPEGEKVTLQYLVKTAHGNPVDRSALDEATGYKRSSRDAYLSRLSARRLVAGAGTRSVQASKELFD